MNFKYNIGDETHDDYIYWEVDWDRIFDAIVDILHSQYPKLDRDELSWFLSNEDLYDHFSEVLKDELKDYFEDEAKQQWNEWREDSKYDY